MCRFLSVCPSVGLSHKTIIYISKCIKARSVKLHCNIKPLYAHLGKNVVVSVGLQIENVLSARGRA